MVGSEVQQQQLWASEMDGKDHVIYLFISLGRSFIRMLFRISKTG